VEDDFGVADGVLGSDGEGFHEIARDFGILEAFDFAAVFADEMGMLVGGGFVGVAEGVAPDAVFAADAVDDALGVEGVEGAVDGDGIGVRGEFFENLDRSQGARCAGKHIQHSCAHGSASQFGLFEEFFDQFVIHMNDLTPRVGEGKCEAHHRMAVHLIWGGVLGLVVGVAGFAAALVAGGGALMIS
jgi:hypothetical protein